MATLKLNNSEEYESIGTFKLSKEKTPKAYNNKLNELRKNGMTKEEAETYLLESSIELEVYYHEDYGLFAVESDAVDGGADIYSPYTGEQYEDIDSDNF